MKRFVVFFIALIVLPDILCISDWMYIVGVTREGKGVLSKLYLKIIPGEGNVYVDTFPLVEIDTQASARTAVSIVCRLLKENCSKYDFLFRIEGDTPIVGGPSAGAAMAILTLALLRNRTVRKDVVITGTATIDGLIGAVGAVDKKYDAARKVAKIYLVPFGNRKINGRDIRSIEKEGTRIIIVGDILEAYSYFTNESIVVKRKEVNFKEIDNIIKPAAEDVCSEVERFEKIVGEEVDDYKAARKLMEEGRYYSAASFCTKALSYLVKRYLEEKSWREVEDFAWDTKEKLLELPSTVRYSSKRDLELALIYLDRKEEAEELLEEGVREGNVEKIARGYVRYITARGWLKLINEGNNTLSEADIGKNVMEVVERVRNYVLYYKLFGAGSEEFEKEIEDIRGLVFEGKIVHALFKAKELEAKISLAMELGGGIEKDTVDFYREKALEWIEAQYAGGYLPVMASCYFLYAEDLREKDPSSAVYFYRLAREFSDIISEVERKGAGTILISRSTPPETRKEETKVNIEIPYDLIALICAAGFATALLYVVVSRGRVE